MVRCRRRLFPGLLLWLAAPLLAGAAESAATPLFEKQVLPILRDNCLSCHGGLRKRGDLDLRTHASALKGGASGVIIVPGSADASLLWKKVAADEMPKTGTKLSDKDKAILREWIAAGAPALTPTPAPKPADSARTPGAVSADVDRLLERELTGVTPALLAEDAVFLRRAYLDLTGRIPTAEQARAFLDGKDPAKREKLIDELLARPEYGRHFATIWHHLIVPLNAENKRAVNEPFHQWLADGFNQGRGWDQTVAALLTAAGEVSSTPQTAFMASRQEPGPLALQAGRLFLGVDLECAECHNHPLTSWRQKEDFWGLAAFFGAVRFNPKRVDENTQLPAKLQIPTSALTAVGTTVTPAFPGADKGPSQTKSVRPELAKWATARDNPYLAPNAVNRWWAHFFGRGLVDPLHDFQSGNPPSHPELLALLADEFRASGHDLKHLARCICNSKAYQRGSRSPAAGARAEELFGGMSVKLLTPDVLYDALCLATGHKELPGLVPPPPAKPKKSTPPPPSPRHVFVNLFDQPETPPSPLDYAHGEQQIVLLMNLKALNNPPPLVQQLSTSGKPAEEVVEELYLAALARRPTAAERERAVGYVAGQKEPQRAWTHVLWALLNGAEFVFNH